MQLQSVVSIKYNRYEGSCEKFAEDDSFDCKCKQDLLEKKSTKEDEYSVTTGF